MILQIKQAPHANVICKISSRDFRLVLPAVESWGASGSRTESVFVVLYHPRISFFRSYVPSGDGKNVEAGPSNGGVRPDLSFPYPSAASEVKSSLLADN